MGAKKKELLSVTDIREITGLGRDRVYELMYSGEFTVYRFGNRFMALEKDFYAWLYNEKNKNSFVFKVKGL
ncbi:helix-turn-helix transcriptional regulator [Alkalicoccobacillus gibsonii]|uniref:helix-turn-helix transcriptional regulator n=1 Tax=Alkalicoccobacillus gibsonii TaxID=79881 RepID=UPI001934B143|nr:helix-turn-helix domain-containing protein [Alkalicoccobacillus gibsonii]MBM0064800.1 helix-turn-helix domain-containing protein [Alkalicoccobacillus gibsonii]